MPPNLALLVDCDSSMNGIGSMLFKRLHDTNWEVRDSVLEVLSVIAEISEDSKFIIIIHFFFFSCLKYILLIYLINCFFSIYLRISSISRFFIGSQIFGNSNRHCND